MKFEVSHALATDARCTVFQLQWTDYIEDGLRRCFPSGVRRLGRGHPDSKAQVDWMRQLIEAEHDEAAWRNQVAELQAELDGMQAAFDAFFRLMPRLPISNPLRVHVTAYGPGGSYFPVPEARRAEGIAAGPGGSYTPGPFWPGADVSVRARLQGSEGAEWDRAEFARYVFHESIHLAIEHPLVQAGRLDHNDDFHKIEGLVSYIQESDQARTVCPAPPWPEGYASPPDDRAFELLARIPALTWSV